MCSTASPSRLIPANEWACLGKNGGGKSTLFKILTGELDYDSGEVMIAPHRRIGLISQIPVYPAGYTVEDVLESAFARIHDMERELKNMEARMGSGDDVTGTAAPLWGAVHCL